MRYGLIDPRTRQYDVVVADELPLSLVGLTNSETDHGAVAPRLMIVVYEYSLFVPPEKQSYFAIGRQLFGGVAVLYRVDKDGETIDFTWPIAPKVRWFADRAAVEREIEARLLDRPVMSISSGNEVRVFWQWPDPRPDIGPIIKGLV